MGEVGDGVPYLGLRDGGWWCALFRIKRTYKGGQMRIKICGTITTHFACAW